MRPLLAIGIAAAILGTVEAYMLFQASLPHPKLERIEQPAAGKFALDLTLTFAAQADNFEPHSLQVLFAGQEVLSKTDPLPPGTPVVVDLPTLVEGQNELFIQAGVGESDSKVARAVRARILRDGTPIAEQTLWSEPGEPVAGAMTIDVPQAAEDAPHDH